MAARGKFLMPVAIGLCSTHCLAAAFIYYSNQAFHARLAALLSAGYLTVPNVLVMPLLKTAAAAFNSALFFTLTAGLALSISATIAAWLWRRTDQAAVPLTIIAGLFAVGYLILANQNGFSPFCSALLAVPGIVFGVTLKVFKKEVAVRTRNPFLHITLFVLFAGVISTQTDINLFLNIRDKVLLSTAIGRTINAFYYDNSLYASQVFKSQSQRLLKTCRLESNNLPPKLAGRLARTLAVYDYLPVTAPVVDLEVSVAGDDILFKEGARVLARTPQKVFFANPSPLIEAFQRQSDRYGFFRSLIMASLILSGAILLYAGLYAPLYGLGTVLLPKKASFYTTGVLCLFLGWAIAYALSYQKPVQRSQLDALLASPAARDQIAALKYVYQKKIDALELAGGSQIHASPSPAVRYWFAKALTYSKRPRASRLLTKLLADPEFNVVCMALYSMGRRGDRRVVSIITGKLQTSSNWYEQWYGYRALKNLGWVQKPSI